MQYKNEMANENKNEKIEFAFETTNIPMREKMKKKKHEKCCVHFFPIA